MYQEEDFIQNYMYLLITTEVYSMEWLASQDQPLKVLLLSDLSPTEETFLAKQIPKRSMATSRSHISKNYQAACLT